MRRSKVGVLVEGVEWDERENGRRAAQPSNAPSLGVCVAGSSTDFREPLRRVGSVASLAKPSSRAPRRLGKTLGKQFPMIKDAGEASAGKKRTRSSKDEFLERVEE
jgi:hypothetical protein